MATLSNGKKLEFEFVLERYYGGKWHEYRSCSRVGSFMLPLFGNFRASAYDRHIMRVKSFEALYVSKFGYTSQRWDFGSIGLETVKVSPENMGRIHELLVDAGLVDRIPEVLRYMQRLSKSEEVCAYAL